MAIDVQPAGAPLPLPPHTPPSTSDDEHWAAWYAKGAAHDRIVRRRLAVALPLLAVIGVVLGYVFFGR